MNSDAQVDAATALPYVSTGHLPPPEQVRGVVAAAYEHLQVEQGRKKRGRLSCSRGRARGSVRRVRRCHWRRHLRHRRFGPQFLDQSVSKPFVFALVYQAVGEDRPREAWCQEHRMPFNSLSAIERTAAGRPTRW